MGGKGGTGKTFVASAFAQCLMGREHNVLCADTDPVNPTFSTIKELGAKHVNITPNGAVVDASAFDELVEILLGHTGSCVVDNGSSSFLPLLHYIHEHDLINAIAPAKVCVHTVLVGDQAMNETMRGLQGLLDKLPAPIVVWENEHFGKLVREDRGFRESALYTSNQDRIIGIVNLPVRSSDTFEADLYRMTSAHQTFEQAIAGARLMSKQRLRQVLAEINAQLDKIPF